MNAVQKNIMANYIGRAWSFISVFIFVPFYLRLLGSEAYGIVSFYSVVLGFLAFADAGLTATLSREFSRNDKTWKYKSNLLYTIEVIYSFICSIIIVSIWILAPLLADKWLNITNIPNYCAIRYIRMIGFGVAFQFVVSLYQGGLMGLQKQVLANGLQIGFGVFRYGVLLIPLYFFPTLDFYFVWQIGTIIFYVLILRIILKRQIKVQDKPTFSKLILTEVWRFAAGMMTMSVLSSILIQSDKLITSKLFSLSEFGFYTLASTLGQVPLMLVTPIGLAILPKLTQLTSLKDTSNVVLLFRRTTFIIVAIASILAFFLIAYMPDILFLWTQNTEMVNSVTQVARILCLGSLFQSTQLMPYYLAIANGHTSTNVKLGIFSVIFLVPAIILFSQYLGIIGVGIPWLIMSVFSFFILSYVVVNKFFIKQFKMWFCCDTMKPLCSAFLVVGIMFILMYFLPKGWFVIGYGFITIILWSLLTVWQFNKQFPNDKILIRISRKGL